MWFPLLIIAIVLWWGAFRIEYRYDCNVMHIEEACTEIQNEYAKPDTSQEMKKNK
jgi:hypothetical protein